MFSNFKNLFGTFGCGSKHFFNIIGPTVMVNEMSFQTYQLSGSQVFNVWKGGSSSYGSILGLVNKVTWNFFSLLLWWVDQR